MSEQSVSMTVAPSTKGDWLKVWVIGLSGLVPFVVCLVGVLIAEAEWDRRFIDAMVVYGALVATFSAGVRWGAEIIRAIPGPPDPARLARSAPPLVAGLISVLLLPVSWLAAVGLIIVTGLALLVWDFMAVRAKLLPGWMGTFRVTAALLAIGLMLATSWHAAKSSLAVGTSPSVQSQPVPPATDPAQLPPKSTP
jgi:Protein of unknown function (DUF3429)